GGPGGDASEQVGGELIHPPGVEDLTALGFAPLTSAGAQPVRGFAVIDERAGSTSLLPYGDGQGMALEHAHLRRHLSEGLEGRSGISVWPRARIAEISRNGPDGIEAAVRREGSDSQLVRARLLYGDAMTEVSHGEGAGIG